MTQFKNGQMVDVAFSGKVISVSTLHNFVDIKMDGNGAIVTVPVAYAKLGDPEGWRPQFADIWEAKGIEYVVRRTDHSDEYLVALESKRDARLYRADRGDGFYDYDDFKKLDPILIRRKSR